MNILTAIDQIGPNGFAGFASVLGVVALFVYGSILLFLKMSQAYRRLDNMVKKAGFYGVLTAVLSYLIASMTFWMAIHLGLRTGIVR